MHIHNRYRAAYCPPPTMRRVRVETSPGHTEDGWLAGHDAHEHALVLIDGETAWRAFHHSKVLSRGAEVGPTATPTLGVSHELALVWAKSESAARMFFGAPIDAVVTVVKERPESDEEKRRYHHNAKLYGVAYEKTSREFVQATAGARVRTARDTAPAPASTLDETLAIERCTKCDAPTHPADSDDGDVCAECANRKEA